LILYKADSLTQILSSVGINTCCLPSLQSGAPNPLWMAEIPGLPSHHPLYREMVGSTARLNILDRFTGRETLLAVTNNKKSNFLWGRNAESLPVVTLICRERERERERVPLEHYPYQWWELLYPFVKKYNKERQKLI
jgi:hypothetical protein